MKNRLRIACAYDGALEQARTHVESWMHIDEVVPYAVFDRDGDPADVGLPVYDDLKLMLREIRPDVLDVIVPPEAQAEVIRTALNNSVRTIVCDAPFCANIAEAREVLAEAEVLDVAIVVHDSARFRPWVRTLKALLEKDVIGTVHQASFRADLSRDIENGRVDIARFLFGTPSQVFADMPAKGLGHVFLDHPNDVRTVFVGHTENVDPDDIALRVEGTKGTISLKNDDTLSLRWFRETDENSVFTPNRFESKHFEEVHALQNHVTSGLIIGIPLENTARDYLEVKQTIEAVFASNKTGRKIKIDADRD